MRETWVQSLLREDLLEKAMATHSSILAWKIPWMEEPGRLHCSPWGCKESDTTEQLHFTSPLPQSWWLSGKESACQCRRRGRVQSLGQEDPLEKEWATRTGIHAWEIPSPEEPAELQSMGLQKSWTWLSDETAAVTTQLCSLSALHCLGPWRGVYLLKHSYHCKSRRVVRLVKARPD